MRDIPEVTSANSFGFDVDYICLDIEGGCVLGWFAGSRRLLSELTKPYIETLTDCATSSKRALVGGEMGDQDGSEALLSRMLHVRHQIKSHRRDSA